MLTSVLPRLSSMPMREKLVSVPLEESYFEDVDRFERDLKIYLHQDEKEIVVTFTGGFSTSKDDHIWESVVQATFDIVRKNHNYLPKSTSYVLDESLLGRDYVRFKSDDLYLLLTNLLPDKPTIDQLINSNVEVYAPEGTIRTGAYIRDFWNTVTVNLAKKGFKIVKVSQ